MRLRTFQGLRPAPAVAAQVASLPYDVVDRDESRALAEGNPLSYLRVVRADLEFPDTVDAYDDCVYQRAKENLEKLIREGHLLREEGPQLYVYQQRMGSHVQAGIVGVCHVDDYENDVIRKHEKTRKAKEDDRTRLGSTLSANTGPVFLTYRARASIDRIVDATRAGKPLFDFVAADGIGHTVWKVSDSETVVREFASIKTAYVADGHHRSASAARTARERREANPKHTGEEDYNWFLSVLFPDNQLRIFPYNRTVCDLNGRSKESFLAALAGIAVIGEAESPVPSRPGEVCFFLGDRWRRLVLDKSKVAGDPIAELDVSQLQDEVLGPILGIGDPRTDERIDFVGGIRGTGTLEERVRKGKAAVAFSMYPVTVDQLMAIADAGAIMPPKSTWFEPKLRSGLFLHTF